eukprot:TRINITY_DN99610_c0_g1_i1.p1 TRINITY_DN99610_c0_g1~~TRINITY_DN99610_c0_g1_i1.p1  ORF type:complete len:409 (+),score=74.14 TRINITY_DN99610_c0_g1_i1:99-1325(+)
MSGSQARHVNCKWQSNERPSGYGKKVFEKGKTDKLSVQKPPGISKDELVKYLKKYGKVTAHRDIEGEFIVQFDGIEPVDLAISLQDISEHEIKGYTFEVKRWLATDYQQRLWDESAGKRKAADPGRPGLDIKFGRKMPEPGAPAPVPTENPFSAGFGGSALNPLAKGERNEFGHLPGCECVTCKKLGAALMQFREREAQAQAGPFPPGPADVAAAEEPELPQTLGPMGVATPIGVSGHLPGCVCPKCSPLVWENCPPARGGSDAAEEMPEDEYEPAMPMMPGPIRNSFGFGAWEEEETSGKGMGKDIGSFGNLGLGVGMLTQAKSHAPAPADPGGGKGAGKAVGKGIGSHLPGCLCSTCRAAGASTPALPQRPIAPPQNPKPLPKVPAKGQHLPGCFCKACREAGTLS